MAEMRMLEDDSLLLQPDGLFRRVYSFHHLATLLLECEVRFTAHRSYLSTYIYIYVIYI